MFWLIIWSLSLGPITIKSEIQWGLVESHHYFAASREAAWTWDQQGNLLQTIRPPGAISSLYVEDGIVFLNITIHEGSKPYNATWVQKGADGYLDRAFRFRWLQRSDGQTYVTFQAFYEEIQQRPFPFQLAEVDLNWRPHRLEWTVKEPMFKARPIQRRFLNNWKRLWIERDGDTYMVMNQLEPAILIYDPATREAERTQGQRLPSHVPTVPLALPGFVPAPAKPFSLDDYTNDTVLEMPDYRAILKRWLMSFSRIVGFHRLDTNFLVAYSVPCLVDVESFPCETFSLGLVNRNGELITQESFGQNKLFAGIEEGIVVIFDTHSSEGKVAINPIRWKP